MRYAFPQPWRDLDHTADVGVAVEGASAEEALARLVLAYAALITGGPGVAAEREERVAARGAGLPAVAVEVLRELLFRFATARAIPVACEVLHLDASGAELTVAFGRYDPDLHAEGLDLKAVTRHAARLEPHGAGWRGQVVFDI